MKAKFTLEIVGFEVPFTNESENAARYECDFEDMGDMNTSTAENPVKTYDEAGEYTVTLKAFDGSGANDSVSQDVRVGPTPPLEKLTGSTGGANSSKTWILHRLGFALGTWPGDYIPQSCKYHRRKRILLVAWSIDGKFYTPTRETLHPRQ